MSPLYFVNVGEKSDNGGGSSCHILTTWTTPGKDRGRFSVLWQVISKERSFAFAICHKTENRPLSFLNPLLSFRQTPVRF